MQNINKVFSNSSKDDSGGILCVLEGRSPIVPFNILRVYYTCGVKEGYIRGYHAHKTLNQVLVCLSGKIEITMDDGLGNISTTIINGPTDSLFVGSLMWHTMKWLEDDSILLVLASQRYNELDYIRDYCVFLETVKMKGRQKKDYEDTI